ncbi:ABC transporter substrate-binding protein [Acrocarpospora pleiomorpha]|uniref:ABC transporter substrate-binding protein n=1 Tax=Acrocarpospora pleiomorpha TaxID=90975 RepID=A0A5M3XUX4_9ACTN|nr:ABC transporter substrate-binding protein [Acrocarpospora pleiomorpha]GES24686.1 ABC transporter substrate-binding protein [Acrocarpospora pleiomorpha]
MFRWYRRFICIAASAALVGVVAGCGGSDDRGASKDLSGEPVKISLVGDIDAPALGVTTPQLRDAAVAAVEAVNRDGGINGRPLELTVCNTQGDPNIAAKCARTSINDGDAASVGTYAIAGGATPVFTAARFPTIGNFPLGPEDFDSPFSYPIVGGTPSAGTCSVALLADVVGVKKIGVLYSEAPASAAGNIVLERALSARGLKATRFTALPPNATDLTPYMTEVAQGSDAVVLVMAPVTAARVVKTARGLGLDTDLVSVSLATKQLTELGRAAERLYQCSLLRPASAGGPGIDQMLREMKAANITPDVDDTATNAWLAVHLFAQVAATLDEITPATVAAAMDRLTDGDLSAIAPPLNTTEPFAGTADTWPRLFNPTVWYGQIADGKIALLRDNAVNPFQPAE